MGKHTPGPWEFFVFNKLFPQVLTIGARKAGVGKDHLCAGELSEADARLISAAPDLLEALKALHNYIDRELLPELDDEWKKQIRQKMDSIVYAALAKAEGSSEKE